MWLQCVWPTSVSMYNMTLTAIDYSFTKGHALITASTATQPAWTAGSTTGTLQASNLAAKDCDVQLWTQQRAKHMCLLHLSREPSFDPSRQQGRERCHRRKRCAAEQTRTVHRWACRTREPSQGSTTWPQCPAARTRRAPAAPPPASWLAQSQTKPSLRAAAAPSTFPSVSPALPACVQCWHAGLVWGRLMLWVPIFLVVLHAVNDTVVAASFVAPACDSCSEPGVSKAAGGPDCRAAGTPRHAASLPGSRA